MADKHSRVRTLGAREQLAYMRRLWPNFRFIIKGAMLVGRGCVQPLPFTREYHVRVQYRVGDLPRTFVEKPQLERRDRGGIIPHTYADDEPCLFYPVYREWTSQMPIALTIMPWLLEWLIYYEAWRLTGEWLGGGIHFESGMLVEEPPALHIET